jgi:hypothetical protein
MRVGFGGLSAASIVAGCLLGAVPAWVSALPGRGPGQFVERAPQPLPSESQRLLLQLVRVKPEMVDRFVYLQRNETVPALKKSGVPWREVYQTTAVGHTGLFAILTEIESLEQADDVASLARTLGDGHAQYQRRLRATIQESEASIIRTRPDLSLLPGDGIVPRLAVVTRLEAVPGKHRQFEAWIKSEYLDVVRKSNCRAFWVSQTLLGGAGSEYWSLTFGDSFAAFDQSPMMQVFESGSSDRVAAQTAQLISRVERWVARYRDDLSFAQPPRAREDD